MPDKQLIEQFDAGHALRFREGGDLGEHDDGTVRILVAEEVGPEIAVAFLASEDEEARVFQAQVARLASGSWR